MKKSLFASTRTRSAGIQCGIYKITKGKMSNSIKPWLINSWAKVWYCYMIQNLT